MTNVDVSTPAELVQVEHWYRHRTDIEALNRDAKHGAALRHLPSGDRTVYTVWMWAALIACAIFNWIQEISGIDDGRGRQRRTLARLRRELINIPARLTRPPDGTYSGHHWETGPGCSTTRAAVGRENALPGRRWEACRGEFFTSVDPRRIMTAPARPKPLMTTTGGARVHGIQTPVRSNTGVAPRTVRRPCLRDV